MGPLSTFSYVFGPSVFARSQKLDQGPYSGHREQKSTGITAGARESKVDLSSRNHWSRKAETSRSANGAAQLSCQCYHTGGAVYDSIRKLVSKIFQTFNFPIFHTKCLIRPFKTLYDMFQIEKIL